MVSPMNKIVALCLALIVLIVLFFVFMPGKSKEPKILTINESESSKTTETLPAPQTAPEKNAAENEDSQTASAQNIEELPGLVEEVLLSPDQEVEINDFLSAWKKAWQKSAGVNGNVDDFASFYSVNFTVAGLDKKGWVEKKANRNARKEWIEVLLNNVSIMASPAKDTAKVTFRQEYSSSNYSDNSLKQLTIRKETDGWKIISEE